MDILIGLVFGAVAVIVAYLSGEKSGKRKWSQHAQDGANKRKETRDEIDLSVGTGGGAADRLHNDWSRD